MSKTIITSQLIDAARCAIARRDRTQHPSGSFDNHRRWYPNRNERQSCCDAIRYPSAKWPLSLNKHCRSVEHVATMFGVEGIDLKRTIKAVESGNDSVLKAAMFVAHKEVQNSVPA